ncbi:hypothetical protein E4167_35560 [Pseudomonas veronii]|uniref:Uncharacterized protein n=1 Tax=Pseudomonas veronii TaxID=76761 RepID=A0A6B9XEF6_PSEVE|nr:hypothetical protein E4167_35560 [Pseudomonas veronii]
MATFKNPLIASLGLVTKASLLISVSLNPSRLPMDRVDMNDRKTCVLAHRPSQRTFS